MRDKELMLKAQYESQLRNAKRLPIPTKAIVAIGLVFIVVGFATGERLFKIAGAIVSAVLYYKCRQSARKKVALLEAQRHLYE